MPNVEDMGGDVGVGEVNRRPRRREESRIKPGKGGLQPGAGRRQGRGARGGGTPLGVRLQAERGGVQEVSEGRKVEPRNLFIAYKKDSVSLDTPFIQAQPQGLTPNTWP